MHPFLIPVLACIIWAPPDNRVPIAKSPEVKGEVAPAPAPVVTVYSTPGCVCSLHIRRDTKGDCRDRDWKFVTKLHKHQPKAIQEIAVKEGAYPILVWNDKSGKPVYAVGWQGLARFLRRYDASMGTAGTIEPPSNGNTPTVPLLPVPDNTPLPPPIAPPAPEPPGVKS